MMDEVEENWRDKEESLQFAVLKDPTGLAMVTKKFMRFYKEL